jgi:hypothetical protein
VAQLRHRTQATSLNPLTDTSLHPSRSSRRRLDEDRTKALIIGNALLFIIFWCCVDVQQGQNRHLLRNFAIADIACVALYVGNAFFSDGWIKRNMGGNDQERDKLFFPFWLVVTLNAVVIGYLVWQTGGPAKSPYTAIPTSMLVIGQQLRAIKAKPAAKRSLIRIVADAIWEFRLYVFVAGAFYGALLYLQDTHSQPVTGAPAGLAVGVAAALFFVSSMTNYITHSLRASRELGGENSG